MNEEQQQPQQAVMKPPLWIELAILKKHKKIETAPLYRFATEYLHQYAKVIRRIKTMGNINWRKVRITISFLSTVYNMCEFDQHKFSLL
jgi:hypothetical protein